MTAEPDFRPPFISEYGEPGPSRLQRAQEWVSRTLLGERQAQPTSGYLTLVPLNDRRLQPRRTALLVTCLLLFTVGASLATFFLVPRGVTAGDIYLHSDRMSWNVSTGSYQLKLKAHIPIYNYNWLSAKVQGELHVLFYTSEAGRQTIESVRVPAKSSPYMLEVDVDASNVPARYAITILSQCMSFPRQLIFFMRGSLSARLPMSTTTMSPLDMYWLINCDGESPVAPEASAEQLAGSTQPQLQGLPQPAREQQPLVGDAAGRLALQQLAASQPRPPAEAVSSSRGVLRRQDAFRIPDGRQAGIQGLQQGGTEAGLAAHSSLQAGAEQSSLDTVQSVMLPGSRDPGLGAENQQL